MSDIYSNGTYLASTVTWHEEDGPYKVQLVQKALSRSADIGLAGRWVDVGCGSGAVASLLQERFPQVQMHGYDVSSNLAPFWARRPNVQFKQANLLATSEVFDVALCLDVFEHVDDYIGFLRALRSRARHFVFNIPLDMTVLKMLMTHRGERERLGHLHYFSTYTALATLDYCGYTVLDSFHAAGYLAKRPNTVRQLAALGPRWLLGKASPSLAATLVGGFSLVVTARQ